METLDKNQKKERFQFNIEWMYLIMMESFQMQTNLPKDLKI